MFYELWKRRNIRIRYERYAHGMTAAAVYNGMRTKDEQPVVTAMDFCRTPEQVAARDRLLQAKDFIRKSIMSIPKDWPRKRLLETRTNVIQKLLAGGFEEAEQVFDEMCPHLKPEEHEISKAGRVRQSAP